MTEELREGASFNYAVPVDLLQECRRFIGNKPYDTVQRLNAQQKGLGVFDNLTASESNPNLAIMDVQKFEVLLNLIGVFPYVEVYKIMDALKASQPLPRELPPNVAESLKKAEEAVGELPEEAPEDEAFVAEVVE